MCDDTNKFVERNEYFKPVSVQEALGLLKRHSHNAVIVAGATDIFVRKSLIPPVIIDIMGTGLDYIKQDGNILRIGSCVTCKQLVEQLAGGPFQVIADAAALLGSPQIRNMATIGGNLCNAAPSADCAPSLYILNAKVAITSLEGSRTLTIDKFITGPGKTALEPGEILEEIRVPLPEADLKTCFEKAVRTKGLDLALVNGAIALQADNKQILKKLKICLGAVSPTPVLLDKELAAFENKKLTEEVITNIADFCASHIKPISDVRASKDYRILRSKTIVERSIKNLLQNQSQ